ncbi:hypothetical protein MHH85_07435 [Viridibacillus sp. FSL E2-0187]|uniref:hypothetical protein n=1 Tax=Viridibacillus TaxID=496496 RepID=UPI00187BA025|nr:hypothetical protein [Viridibacillus sp. JNUCC-6]QOV12152.1 hypothetical protein JNUCC6_05110 [Viridibacillus sp. JNUCC-6]
MKKFLGLLSVASLGLFLSFGIPTHSSANSSSSDAIAAASYSQYVSVNRYFNGNVVPPSTIAYNSGGYSGTLQRQAYQFDGTRTIATYSGTVYCSGSCPIPN